MGAFDLSRAPCLVPHAAFRMQPPRHCWLAFSGMNLHVAACCSPTILTSLPTASCTGSTLLPAIQHARYQQRKLLLEAEAKQECLNPAHTHTHRRITRV